MTDAAIATDVHETFDVELDLGAQVALDFIVVADDFAHGGGFGVCPVLYFLVYVHAGLLQDFLCGAAADAIDVGQGDFTSFVLGEVNSHYSYCHIL